MAKAKIEFDLNDLDDDLKHKRMNKPLVSGLITTKQLKRAIYVVAPFALLFNLLGPLGLKGGSLYLLGVGLGVSYNFYFKSTLLSPLPYALAFAAGAMIFVVVEEVIPETQQDNNTDIATLGFIAGFIVMMSLDVALG